MSDRNEIFEDLKETNSAIRELLDSGKLGLIDKVTFETRFGINQTTIEKYEGALLLTKNSASSGYGGEA